MLVVDSSPALLLHNTSPAADVARLRRDNADNGQAVGGVDRVLAGRRHPVLTRSRSDVTGDSLMVHQSSHNAAGADRLHHDNADSAQTLGRVSQLSAGRRRPVLTRSRSDVTGNSRRITDSLSAAHQTQNATTATAAVSSSYGFFFEYTFQ